LSLLSAKTAGISGHNPTTQAESSTSTWYAFAGHVIRRRTLPHSGGVFGCRPLHIDIPVKLAEVKVVFSVGALMFEGDLSASIFHLQLIVNDVADWNAKAKVVAVFHTNAGHVTLNDGAYNADRNVATGNPYRELVANLMNRGIQIELCGATAKAHKWGNADLLPGVNVNRDAMARTTQLVQEGFVKITE
jgi:intracellular sulfur oxidation DsrE/DsrF family protein